MQLTGKGNIHQVLANLVNNPETPINIVPADEDDLWSLYNIIQKGDVCTALTTRKVHAQAPDDDGKGGKGGKGGESRRETVRLTITVQQLDFDPKVNELRITGFITKESHVAAIGQRHSLTIKDNIPIMIQKPDGWDSIAIAHLQEALTGIKENAVPVVLVGSGVAWIASIRQSRTVPIAKIELPGRNRAKESSKANKAEAHFYNEIISAIKDKLLLADTPPQDLLLVSAGPWAEVLRDHMLRTATRLEDKKLRELAQKAVIAHSNTSLEHGIISVLQSPAIKEKLKNKSFAADQEAIDRLMDLLRKDDGRASYGKRAIEHAVEAEAITKGPGELLILDSLFRSRELEDRKYWVGLTERVREAGGKVTVIGSENQAGEQLAHLGGVAAILSFPVEVEDEVDDLDDDDLEGLIV